jgi:hypothetical protein
MTAPNEADPHPETLATSEPDILETEELTEPGAENGAEPGAEDAVEETIQKWGPPRPALRAAAAFLLYLSTTILLWGIPVVGHLSTRYLANGRGDVDLYRWSLAWVPWAVAHGHTPLFTDKVFAPGGVDLTWSTIIPGPALVAWPVTRLFGTLASHNVLKLLAPALAAWGAYLVCNRLTRAFWPSLVSGYLFGFSAYMVGQMQSHLNLVLVFPIPIAVYLVIRKVEGSMGWITFTALMALTLLGLFSISTEVFATAAVFGAVAFVLAVIAAGKDRMRIVSAALLTGAAYGIVAALLFFPYLLPAVRNSPGQSIRPVDTTAADALGFLIPRHDMLIGGARMSSISHAFTAKVIEDGSYIGIALILAIVGFAITERRRRGTWALIAFIAVGALLSLGSVLHVDGRPMFHLPGTLLANAPLIKHATAQRMPVYTSLAVAVLAGIWLARADDRTRWVRWGIVVVGAVMLLPQLRNPSWYVPDRTPAFFADGTYASVLNPDENVFLITETNGEEMLWQGTADFSFRMPEGYVGPMPTPYARQRMSRGLAVEDGQPFVPSVTEFSQWLAEKGVTAVVLGDLARPKFEGLLQHTGFRSVYEGGGVSVWRVSASSTSGASG